MTKFIRADICVAAGAPAVFTALITGFVGQLTITWPVVSFWWISSVACYAMIIVCFGPFKTYQEFKARNRSRVPIKREFITQDILDSLRFKDRHLKFTFLLLPPMLGPLAYFALTNSPVPSPVFIACAGGFTWFGWLFFLLGQDHNTLRKLLNSAQDQTKDDNSASLDPNPS